MKTEITVRNCPPSFRFQCPQQWESLAVTADAAVRHCSRCQQDVHYCVTDSETIEHAKAGHCIARELPDASELPMLVLGQPLLPIEHTESQEKALQWSHRESGIDDSISNSDAIRSCPQCQFPAPHWRVECRVCGFAFGRIPPKWLE